MKAEIVVFSLASQPMLDQIDINPFQSELIKTVEEKKSAVLCLIENCWKTEIEKDKDHFVLKEKHPSTELTRYFSKCNEKILVLQGSCYTDFSQFKRSINDFLKNAFLKNLHSLNFILVSNEFFIKAKEESLQTFPPGESRNGNNRGPRIRSVNTRIDLKQMYIGNSEPCVRVRKMIGIAAENDFPVLILGESGTGKEVVARGIHDCSKRHIYPFYSINCSAISPYLFESELFGYVKGATPEAKTDKKGLWEVADKSTLFLDEIGDLKLNHQAKILRALETGEILPVGATKPIKVDTRILAATNKPIEASSNGKNKEFREDLFYRISTLIIHTPILDSHREDIPDLAKKLWKDLETKKDIDKEALNYLLFLNYPNNVRSLRDILRRLSVMFDDKIITKEHVQDLQHYDMISLLNSTQNMTNCQKPVDDKDFEKCILKIEFLLKAALYSENGNKRRDLLEKVKESLSDIME